MNQEDTYEQLIAFLAGQGVPYRLIDHAPEGRTELVSSMRGNALAQAAKCIVLMVNTGSCDHTSIATQTGGTRI